MLQSLSTLTALQELRVAKPAQLYCCNQPTGVDDATLQQWGCNMQHLTSLQLPDTWVAINTAPLPCLCHLQHVSFHSVESAGAFVQPEQPCSWQVLQLSCARSDQLPALPLLPGLVRPVSVDCLRLYVSDRHLLQLAIARVAECSKLGPELQELEVRAGTVVDPAAQGCSY
jgi:hypothetical protein